MRNRKRHEEERGGGISQERGAEWGSRKRAERLEKIATHHLRPQSPKIASLAPSPHALHTHHLPGRAARLSVLFAPARHFPPPCPPMLRCHAAACARAALARHLGVLPQAARFQASATAQSLFPPPRSLTSDNPSAPRRDVARDARDRGSTTMHADAASRKQTPRSVPRFALPLAPPYVSLQVQGKGCL